MALFLTLTNTSLLIFGLILGIVIGYTMAILRIRSYLKKYYPEVDFGVSTKERLEKLRKQKEKNEEKNINKEKDK